MREELTLDELADLKMFYLMSNAGDDWDVLMKTIDDQEKDGIEESINNDGDKAVRAKGGVLLIRSLRASIETSIENGQALAKELDSEHAEPTD